MELKAITTGPREKIMIERAAIRATAENALMVVAESAIDGCLYVCNYDVFCTDMEFDGDYPLTLIYPGGDIELIN